MILKLIVMLLVVAFITKCTIDDIRRFRTLVIYRCVDNVVYYKEGEILIRSNKYKTSHCKVAGDFTITKGSKYESR